MSLENNPEKFLPGDPPDSLSLEDLVYFVKKELGRGTLVIPEFLGSETFSIEITGIPEGPALEEVRREWVGVTISEAREFIKDDEGGVGRDLKEEKTEKGSSYAVPITTALPALLEHSVPAARWWATRSPMYGWLFFKKDVARVVEEQKPVVVR